MNPLLAALPLIIAIVLIVVARQSALTAGLALLASALALGWFSATGFDFASSGQALWLAVAITAPIAYILLGGVFLYWVLRAGGALDAIARMTAAAAPNPGLRILLLVYGLGVFFESATGFGVGIIVTAPLFLSLGYSPLRAGLLALLGQCAVPWGALAVGTTLGAQLAGLSLTDASLHALLLSIPSLVLCGAAALWVAQVKQSLWLSIAQVAGLALALMGGITLCSLAGAAELAGCVGGLTVIALVLALRRAGSTAIHATQQDSLRMLTPLAVLVISLALTRLVTPLGDALKRYTITSADGIFQLAPVYHAGFWLLVAAVVGMLVFRLPYPQILQISRSASMQWVKAVLAVAGFIASGQVMSLAGMTESLTQSAALAPQWSLPLLMPLVGALGGFLTASNAGSNAIFMGFQVHLTALAQFDLNYTAAAQNAAASIACMMSPGRLALAQLLIGQEVREHELLRAIAPVALLGVLSMMLLLWLIAL